MPEAAEAAAELEAAAAEAAEAEAEAAEAEAEAVQVDPLLARGSCSAAFRQEPTRWLYTPHNFVEANTVGARRAGPLWGTRRTDASKPAHKRFLTRSRLYARARPMEPHDPASCGRVRMRDVACGWLAAPTSLRPFTAARLQDGATAPPQ